MENDNIIAFRTREQLRKHLGMFSPQFKNNRWKMEFLGQMPFGIQAARDTFVSEIARTLQEDILAKVWDGSKGRVGDNLFKFHIDHGHNFIARLVRDRNLLNWGGRTKDSRMLALELARQCTMKYEDGVHFKSHNKVHDVRVKYGSMPVR